MYKLEISVCLSICLSFDYLNDPWVSEDPNKCSVNCDSFGRAALEVPPLKN